MHCLRQVFPGTATFQWWMSIHFSVHGTTLQTILLARCTCAVAAWHQVWMHICAANMCNEQGITMISNKIVQSTSGLVPRKESCLCPCSLTIVIMSPQNWILCQKYPAADWHSCTNHFSAVHTNCYSLWANPRTTCIHSLAATTTNHRVCGGHWAYRHFTTTMVCSPLLKLPFPEAFLQCAAQKLKHSIVFF